MPMRFECLPKEKQMALAGLCPTHGLFISMPLTFSHTSEKRIKNESLLLQEVNFPGQVFPYGEENGTRPEHAQ